MELAAVGVLDAGSRTGPKIIKHTTSGLYKNKPNLGFEFYLFITNMDRRNECIQLLLHIGYIHIT